MNLKVRHPAPYIDNTILKPDADEHQVRQFCIDSAEFHFACVCVNPWCVKSAVQALSDTDIAVCSVTGFPFGAGTTETKVFEALQALDEGAREIDAVINIGQLKQGAESLIEFEIRKLSDACHERDAVLKIIIETSLLNTDQKKYACELIIKGGADFVKTSTGFSTGGASVEDVRLLAECTSGTGVKVKASGGISTYKKFCDMIEAGAGRIGTSSGIEIVTGATQKQDN